MSLHAVSDQQVKLPFRPIGEALCDVPETPDWLVDGLVARMLLTILGGRPKVGKSTLLFALLAALARGLPFLGRNTTQARALLLTEERGVTLQEKRKLFGLGENDLHVLMRHEAVGSHWVQTVRQATDYCHQHGLALLVIDALDKWIVQRSGNESENSTADTLANLAPVMDAAGTGLAVMIVAHQGKQNRQYGEALRGSNALAGAMDVILELERSEKEDANPGDRVLKGTSRLLGTPEEIRFSRSKPDHGGRWG